MKSKEGHLQSECVKWFRLAYPKLALLMVAIPNGGSRNAMEARNLKLQGVTPGVADLVLFVARQGYHGLCIEMKYGTGKQTDTQKVWEKAVVNENYQYRVIRNFDEFISLIDNYLVI